MPWLDETLPTMPALRSPETGSASGRSALSRAESLVTDLAKSLETGEAASALADGDRAGAEAVLSLADRLRSLLEGAERSLAAVGENSLRDALATRRVESRGSPVVMRSKAKPHPSRTAFRRSGSQIVKLGMVGTAKAYRHFAPLLLVDRVARVAEQLMRDRGEFSFEDVWAAIPNDKGYQVRLVIAWMRSVGVLTSRTKGRYLAEPDLLARITSALEALEPERRVAAGSRRSRRMSPGRTVSGNTSSAKRSPSA